MFIGLFLPMLFSRIVPDLIRWRERWGDIIKTELNEFHKRHIFSHGDVTVVASVNGKVIVNALRNSLVAEIDQLMRMAKAVVSPTFINEL